MDIPAVMGIHCPGARTNHARIMAAGWDSVAPIDCPLNQRDGVQGCIDCHKILAREGLNAGYSSFAIIEGNAVPSPRFDRSVIRGAFEYLERRPEQQFVMLGMWMWPYKSDKVAPHVVLRHPYIGSFAYVATRAFAQRIVSDDFQLNGERATFDWWLMNNCLDGRQAISYPMPLVRSRDLVSFASPDFNAGMHKFSRQVLGGPEVSTLMEWSSVYWSTIIAVLITVTLLALLIPITVSLLRSWSHHDTKLSKG